MTSQSNKRFLPALILAVSVLTSPLALSEDKIITKSGRTYIGKIIGETPENVTIRFERFKGITETEAVDRSEIVEIQSESPDLVDFKALGDILPTADLLTPAEYQKRLDGPAAEFLKKHPNSKYRPEVERILATLGEEKARADKGDRKVDGEWLTADEIKKNKFNIDATILLAEMNGFAAAGDTLQALRTYERIEADYPISKAFPRAAAAAVEIAKKHKTVLADLLARLPERQAKRDDFSGLEPAAAARAKNAIRMEDAKWAKIRKDEEQAKVLWRSVYGYSKEDITKAIQATDREIARIGKIDIAKATRVAEAAEAGFRAFEEGDYKQAGTQFSLASTAGGRHPLIDEMRKRADQLFQQHQKDTEAERAAAALTAKLQEQQGSTIAPRSKPETREPNSKQAPPKNPGTTAQSTDSPSPPPSKPKMEVQADESMSLRSILVALLVVVVIGMVVANLIARKKGVPDDEI